MVTAQSTVLLPLTGKVLTEAKLRSKSTEVPHDGAIDGEGNAVDPRALLAAEGAAKIARQGKLRDDVYARSLTSSSELVPISIWADFGDEHAPREQMISNPTLRAANKTQTRSRLRAVTSKVTAWLDSRGFRTHDRGLESPVITADVPPSALTELGRLDGIAIVHLSQPDVPAGTVWFNSVKGPTAQMVVGSVNNLAFCNGEGSQPDDYTDLSLEGYFDATAQASFHTRWTSELISATAGIRMAPGGGLFVAGWDGTPSTKYSAWEWCYGNGIQNLNRSAGTGVGAPSGLLAEDMAQDYYVYHYPYPLITESAGNCENEVNLQLCSQQPGVVTVTSRSYNTLIVGASDDNNTVGTSDDYLASFSQYGNPTTTHNDFELPNLVAPGSSGYTAGIGSASGIGRGTSASAPIVMGTVLLMKTVDPNLAWWPEMMRATILTASTHPIDGPRTQMLGGIGDIKQGAGLLNSAVAVNLANPSLVRNPNYPGTSQGRFEQWYDFSTDFPNSGFISAPYNIVTWSAGRLRVVAAFDATAQGCSSMNGSGCTGDGLDGDLDLQVSQFTNGTWHQVCVSQTWDSSWELCDVPVNYGEVYKAELTRHATSSTGTYVGIAWNVYDPNGE